MWFCYLVADWFCVEPAFRVAFIPGKLLAKGTIPTIIRMEANQINCLLQHMQISELNVYVNNVIVKILRHEPSCEVPSLVDLGGRPRYEPHPQQSSLFYFCLQGRSFHFLLHSFSDHFHSPFLH